MTTDAKKLAKALRFCGVGKEPCRRCPFFAELDPLDCQTQIMVKAAELLEQLTEAGT